jgi:hypothetical protein
MQHQDSFPSIDASDINDPSRLPSYRETRRYRYHPYSRPITALVNEEDLLVGFPSFAFSLVFTDFTFIQNTLYDDERVVLNVPPLPARRVVTVEFFHFYSDLVFKPNSHSTHLCPKLLTSSKNVSAKMWNVSLLLNYAFDAFPRSLGSVFFFSFFHIFLT